MLYNKSKGVCTVISSYMYVNNLSQMVRKVFDCWKRTFWAFHTSPGITFSKKTGAYLCDSHVNTLDERHKQKGKTSPMTKQFYVGKREMWKHFSLTPAC